MVTLVLKISILALYVCGIYACVKLSIAKKPGGVLGIIAFTMFFIGQLSVHIFSSWLLKTDWFSSGWGLSKQDVANIFNGSWYLFTFIAWLLLVIFLFKQVGREEA